MALALGVWLALAAGAVGVYGAFPAAAYGAEAPAQEDPERRALDLSAAGADAVLRAVVDHLRGGPLRGTYTFVVERPGRSTEYVMEIVSDGDQRGLIRVVAPPREAGQAFLMSGDDLWLYNARLGRSLRLPPSGRTGAFLGSDVSYNDIVGRDLERDYIAAFASADAVAAAEDAAGAAAGGAAGDAAGGVAGSPAAGSAGSLIVLELTPRQGAPTPYGRVLIGVEATSLAPRWVDYYDQRGQVVKRLTLSEYLESGGRILPLLMEVEDRIREGNRTVVRLSGVELDAAIPESCFTLQALERGCP